MSSSLMGGGRGIHVTQLDWQRRAQLCSTHLGSQRPLSCHLPTSLHQFLSYFKVIFYTSFVRAQVVHYFNLHGRGRGTSDQCIYPPCWPQRASVDCPDWWLSSRVAGLCSSYLYAPLADVLWAPSTDSWPNLHLKMKVAKLLIRLLSLLL